MATSSFQAFVAWRYLMARPRRLSGIIVGFAIVAAAVALGAFGALMLAPLADPKIAFDPVLPVWLPLGLGLGVAAGLVALVSAAIVGAARHARAERVVALATTAGLLAMLGLAVLGVAAYVLDGGRFTDRFIARLVVLLLTSIVATALRLARRPGVALVGLACVVGTLVSAAWPAFIPSELPVLGDGVGSTTVAGVVVLAAIGVGGLVVARLRRSARSAAVGALALAAAPTFALVRAYLGLAGHALGELDRYGQLVNYQPPMEINIAIAISAALLLLSLILLVIRYVFTFFTTVSIGGVVLGTMALVIVLSVMSGFENDLREKILGSNAHIMVTGEDEASISDYRAVGRRIAAVPGVVAQAPFLLSEVVIAANNNGQNVLIKGIDPARIGDVTELDEDADDRHALARLWPLEPDGRPRSGPPATAPAPVQPIPSPAAPGGAAAIDPAPSDLEVGPAAPVDFSGGLTEVPSSPPDAGPSADGGAPVDPAPPDLEVGPAAPIDFSGGLTAAAPPPTEAAAALAEAKPPTGRRAWPALEGARDDRGEEDEDDGARDRGSAGDRVGPAIGADDVLDVDDLDRPLVLAPPDFCRSRGHSTVRDGEVPLFDVGRLGEMGVFGPDWAARDPSRQIPPHIGELPGILIGCELAKQMNLYVGQEVKIVSPLGQDTPIGPVPRTKPYRIAGFFFTGMYEYDLKSTYVDLASLQSFLDLSADEASGIEVRVRDPDDTEGVGRAIAAALGPRFHVQDWKQLNRSLFSALKLEKIAMFLVLAIIILVASFSIVGNLIMVVVEKAKEIAVLKTLGATDQGVMRVFVVQGFFIGLVGTLVGVSLGLAVCWLGIEFGLPLNPDVYYIDKLPIHIEPAAVMAVAAAGVLISVVATLYPAFVAARLQPVKGLRYE